MQPVIRKCPEGCREEEVCYGDPSLLYAEETHDNRIRLIGPRYDGTERLLVVILGPEGEGIYIRRDRQAPKQARNAALHRVEGREKQ
jgi:hypothetical protein